MSAPAPLSLPLEVLLSALIVAGAAFTFIGSLGLVRLRDFYTRLHGPTKATTLGVGCLLVASSVYFSVTGDRVSLHEVLVSLFLFITAPISAHLLAKAALHRKLPSLAPLPDDPPTAAPPPNAANAANPANPPGPRDSR